MITPTQNAEFVLVEVAAYCQLWIGDIQSGVPVYESNVRRILSESQAAVKLLRDARLVSLIQQIEVEP